MPNTEYNQKDYCYEEGLFENSEDGSETRKSVCHLSGASGRASHLIQNWFLDNMFLEKF